MLSEETKRILAGDENLDVEFKESISKDLAETMVAFSNSPGGGTILLGVRETENTGGRQKGEIVGIEVSDDNKLKIISKANSTIDKIFPKIEDETDDNGKSIYKITVSEGTHKPYCTGGGRYLIRADGANAGITPTMMEDIMIERLSLKRSKEIKIDDTAKVIDEFSKRLMHTINKFKEYWKVEKESKPLGIDDAKWQLQQYCDEFIELRAMIEHSKGTPLPDLLSEIARELRILTRHQLYLDGGKSYQAFWDSGERIMEIMDTVLKELNRTIGGK